MLRLVVRERKEHIGGQSPRQRLVVRERIDQIKGQRTRRRLVVIERIEQMEGQRPKRRLQRKDGAHRRVETKAKASCQSFEGYVCVSTEKVVGSGGFWGQIVNLPFWSSFHGVCFILSYQNATKSRVSDHIQRDTKIFPQNSFRTKSVRFSFSALFCTENNMYVDRQDIPWT